MARIAGVDIPNDKRVVVSLTYIYGVGLSTAQKILAENNYKIVSKELNGKAVHEFTDDEVEYFAQREHNAWYRRKVNLGWNRGPRDVENKTNPNIAHWDELDFDTKEANMFTFIKLPESCDKVGLKIIRG